MSGSASLRLKPPREADHMNFLPLQKLGARETSSEVLEFGIFFPGVSPGAGYAVAIRIIHERDQYLQPARVATVALSHMPDETYGDYWFARLNLTAFAPPVCAPNWGQPRRYLYDDI